MDCQALMVLQSKLEILPRVDAGFNLFEESAKPNQRSIEFRDGTATDMPAVLRNGRREAAILLLANHGRTREDWLFGANRAMCVVPGEVRAT